ncbi:hypothetical protein AMTRI_Chr06g169590 [Amborella trichopoda]
MDFMWGCGLILYFFMVLEGLVVNGQSVNFFIFGDSLVDAGTNNYINTSKNHQANFLPYGENSFFAKPTGRFSDGRISPDFIAKLANLPLIPPYLEPGANHSFGANFASAGAGALQTTNQGQVVDMDTQIEQYINLTGRLRRNLGDSKANQVLSNAVYYISAGLNDYKVFVMDYEAQLSHCKEEYVRIVTSNLIRQILELYKRGARKFVFPSLKPLGCTPGMRSHTGGRCLAAASHFVVYHNNALEDLLISLANTLSAFQYIFFDHHEFLNPMMQKPDMHGFDSGDDACCGSGQNQGEYTCGGKSNATTYELCQDASTFVWFDSFHYTERIHRLAAYSMWDGNVSYVRPQALKNFFNMATGKVPKVHLGRKGIMSIALSEIGIMA